MQVCLNIAVSSYVGLSTVNHSSSTESSSVPDARNSRFVPPSIAPPCPATPVCGSNHRALAGSRHDMDHRLGGVFQTKLLHLAMELSGRRAADFPGITSGHFTPARGCARPAIRLVPPAALTDRRDHPWPHRVRHDRIDHSLRRAETDMDVAPLFAFPLDQGSVIPQKRVQRFRSHCLLLEVWVMLPTIILASGGQAWPHRVVQIFLKSKIAKACAHARSRSLLIQSCLKPCLCTVMLFHLNAAMV
jgi:hypothetical protein